MGGDRCLDWDGCFNVRDLGGLPVRGGVVAPGALIRADSVAHLTPDGWGSLVAHGVRTVIDLRNDDERNPDEAVRPAAIDTVTLPLDVVEATDFWDEWAAGLQFGTPLYYLPHLRRFPDRNADVVAAVARARPGGVLFHCVGGRDRTGQVAMILLALLGASVQTIAADYQLSAASRSALAAARGGEDDTAELTSFLAQRGATIEQIIGDTLSGVELAPALGAAGLREADLRALHTRALSPA